MHAAHSPDGAYLRRVWIASAKRSARGLLRAFGVVLLATGAICVLIAVLGWASRG